VLVDTATVPLLRGLQLATSTHGLMNPGLATPVTHLGDGRATIMFRWELQEELIHLAALKAVAAV